MGQSLVIKKNGGQARRVLRGGLEARRALFSSFSCAENGAALRRHPSAISASNLSSPSLKSFRPNFVSYGTKFGIEVFRCGAHDFCREAQDGNSSHASSVEC